MSKEQQARIRNELLQELYRQTLRAHLAETRAGRRRGDAGAAAAAAVCANLTPEDLLLVPRGMGIALAPLRKNPGQETTRTQPPTVEQPRSEAPAVAVALGAATAALRTGSLVCILLPPSARLDEALSPRQKKSFPLTWSEAGEYAAAQRLPLLFVSDGARGTRNDPAQPPAHEQGAPPYPAIPVDRDDTLAIYRVAFECGSRARSGGGPSHIRCLPFTLRGDATPPTDALTRIEAMLRKRGAFDKAWKRHLERDLLREAAGD